MSGRYFEYRAPAAIAAYFQAGNPLANTAPNYNRAPTQDGLVLRRHPETGARHLDPLHWGLVPRWSKDATGGTRMINARSEGITDRPAFREAIWKRRFIATADGFYEWQVHGKSTQPFAVAMASGEPMPLAAQWEGWRGPDGTVLRTFTIITTVATPTLAPLHERMPVILPREAWSVWLAEDPADEVLMLAMLRPFEGAGLRVWPVGPRVGKVSEKDAALLERDPLAVVPTRLDDPPPENLPQSSR